MTLQMTNDILHETQANPLPPSADAGFFTAADGRRIRYARFGTTRRPYRGTVILLSGRNEFIEKYYETIRDLQRRGFSVAIMDWRGQGRSDRLLRDKARGYVRHFRDYVRDLEQFFQELILPDLRGPYYLLAHSTGGLIALLAAPGLNNRVRRMVLSAPLLALNGFPISMRSIRRLSTGLRYLGLGWIYALGAMQQVKPFAMNVVTSDARRYARNQEMIETFPDLGMGGPTFSWVSRFCQAAATVTNPDFMRQIRIPILFVAAGADKVVSTPVIERYARGLRSGSLTTIDGARHEMLQEADIYREQFLAAFDAFIPGGDLTEEDAPGT